MRYLNVHDGLPETGSKRLGWAQLKVLGLSTLGGVLEYYDFMALRLAITPRKRFSAVFYPF